MIKPTLKEFESLSLQSNLIPLSMEIPKDRETPISVYAKLDNPEHSFLLESAERRELWGRYSYIGSDARAVLRYKEGKLHVLGDDGRASEMNCDDPTEPLRSFMRDFVTPQVPYLPEFFGGAVGFLSYDIIRSFERIPDLGTPSLGFHDAWFMVTRDIVIFDNYSDSIFLLTTVSPNDGGSTKASYAEGCRRLEHLRDRLVHERSMKTAIPHEISQRMVFFSNMDKSEFEGRVIKAKEHITAGDIVQVVLSQRFHTDFQPDPLSVYEEMRDINPSPYMFLLKMGDEVLAGSSPEVMVRLRGGKAVVRPIAGTRPRGTTPDEDLRLEAELLHDTKELAEHVMLVDLARNDLGRIGSPGTVKVDEFKIVERYSHVMHMVSNVSAEPAAGLDAYDVIKAAFPAGTLTGAPKIRAMEIIESLEPERRGPYGGCVGYFSYTGAMDMGITIRTVMMKGNMTYFQAGAGIVADSVPEFEYLETMRKAEAMRKALLIAGAKKNGVEK